MLPSAAFVRRVRVQSVPDHNHFELNNLTNLDHQNPVSLTRSLAQACTESSYNSILNVKALKDAVRQKPSLIVIRLSKSKSLEHRISLKNLRRVLLGSHLIVLAATVYCFAYWPAIMDLSYNYKLSTLTTANDRSSKDALDLWMVENFGSLFAESVIYMDRVLSIISGFLLFYYLIFGFVISLFFGGPTDLLIVVLSSPIILLLACCLNIFAIINVTKLFLIRASKGFDGEKLLLDVPEMTHELRRSILDFFDLLEKSGFQFSVVIVLSSFVQSCLAILPWFVYDLPFQRMLDIEDVVIYDIEKRKVKSFPRSIEDVQSARQAQTMQNNSQEPLPERQPYRAMPSAQTVLLQLCPPENRYLHR